MRALFLIAALLVFVPQAQAQWYGGTNIIRESDRAALRAFIVGQQRECRENETRGREPCGMASREVFSFAPGSVLPLEVQDELVPSRVAARLARPPRGTAYVYADDSVYLISLLSREIIDVVSLTTE
jgi:hypothetical protein